MTIDSALTRQRHTHRVGDAMPDRLAAVLGTNPFSTKTECLHCGAAQLLSDLYADMRPTSTALRCATCRAVQALLTQRGGITCVDLRGIASQLRR